MKGYWTTTRPNGQPITPGTFAYVVDPENGENPIWTYGQTEAEVAEKMARTAGHAQMTLARRAPAATQGAPAQGAPPSSRAVAQPRSLSADEVMQATADLSNPAKAGQATARLVQHETGIDLLEMAKRQYATLYLEWERETPELSPHPGNRQMIGDKAIRMAGGKPALVTKEILNYCYEQLRADGVLFEDQSALPSTHQPPTSLPEEIPVQRAERPEKRPFATGMRSTSFRAPQTAQPRTLKYTLEQYRKLTRDQIKRLIGNPDFEAAARAYESPAQRTA